MSDDASKGPNLSPKLGGPSLEIGDESNDGQEEQEKEIPDDPVTKLQQLRRKQQQEAKEPGPKINVHEIIRKWGVIRRRMRDSLQLLLMREVKERIPMTKVNDVLRRNVAELMQGQLDFFQETIQLILDGEDEISLELRKEHPNQRASTQSFDSVSQIINDQLKKLENDKPVIVDYIDEDLKRVRDARTEPRACWWILWYTGLMIREMRDRKGEIVDVTLEVLLKYKPPVRRALAAMLNFCSNLVTELEEFPVQFATTKLTRNPTSTGYNLGPWIRPRYNTYSQKQMTYERFLEYYSRSFGMVPGNAPDLKNGPKAGYTAWINRALVKLEEQMNESPYFVANARGETLEGMLAGLEIELKKVFDEIEYDDEGKSLNQPEGVEGALLFTQWLFHTALGRYSTVNIATNKESRLSFEMFDFVLGTTRWVNAHGESIVVDWLEEYDSMLEDQE